MNLVAQFMNVEEGHKLGVRHVGGFMHVAPMYVVGIFVKTNRFRLCGILGYIRVLGDSKRLQRFSRQCQVHER